MADRKRVADRSTTPARKRKGPVDATARRALRWKGEVERFSAVREGGPGRPQTLFALLLAGGLLVAAGVWYIGKSPDGSGPVMILLGAWALLSLAFWVLVKAGLRSTQVTFVIDRRGVHIRPSTAQRKLDRRMRGLMLLVFWLSLKGGQWAAWSPMTAWRDVKEIRVNRLCGDVLVTGGAWHLRLMCKPHHLDEVLGALHAWCTRGDVIWID